MSRHLVLGVLTTVLLCNPSLGEDDLSSSLVIGGSCLASYSSTTCAALDEDPGDRRREDGGDGGDDEMPPDYIGCGCVTFGTASNKLECTSTGQSLLTYTSADCTGTPTTTSLEDTEGCIDRLGSAVMFVCNYTDMDEDDDEEESCFTLSDQTCGEGVAEPLRRRRVAGEDGDGIVVSGCGCLNDGVSSYRALCNDEPSIATWSNTNCSGEPIVTLSLDDYCVPIEDTNLTVQADCRSFENDDVGNDQNVSGPCFATYNQSCSAFSEGSSAAPTSAGCGCTPKEGGGSQLLECSEEGAELATYSGEDCTGTRTAQSIDDVTLGSCGAFGEGSIVFSCASNENDNDDCPEDDDDCLNRDDDEEDLDPCFYIYAGNRSTPESPVRSGCGCVEQEAPASGSQILECFEGAVNFVTYSGENCTGTRSTQSLSQGLGGATQACVAYGEEGSMCFYCNIGSNDNDDNDDCPEDDDDCLNRDDDEGSGQCFSIHSGCDIGPQRREIGIGGCGCVQNSSTSSYRLECDDGAAILSYDNGNCSGNPTGQTLQSDSGCVPFEGMFLDYSCSGFENETDDCPEDDDDCLNRDDDEDNDDCPEDDDDCLNRDDDENDNDDCPEDDDDCLNRDDDEDNDDNDEDDEADALRLDTGPIGCVARHSASGCSASSEEQSSCSCLNVPGSGSGRVRCDGDEAHLILFDGANCQGSPGSARTYDDGETCGQMEEGLFINVDCSNPKDDPKDNNKDEEEKESTGCMTLHLTNGCSGPEAGTACDCLKAPTGLPTFSAQLKCQGGEPKGVNVYDNSGCSSTPKETLDVGVDTCVSISQYNISVRVDCDSAASGLASSILMLMTALVASVFAM